MKAFFRNLSTDSWYLITAVQAILQLWVWAFLLIEGIPKGSWTNFPTLATAFISVIVFTLYMIGVANGTKERQEAYKKEQDRLIRELSRDHTR